MANDSSASLLFHNNGDGTFKDVGLQAGAALTADGRAQAGMGVGAADYDRDGWLDLVKTNFDDDTTSLYRNLGGGTFEDATTEAGLGVNTRYLGWGTGFLDFDLDSWPDIFIVNGHVYPEADRIGGHYTLPAAKAAVSQSRQRALRGRLAAGGPRRASKRRSSRGAAVGDLFNTGRQDIVVNNMHDTPTLLHNCARARRTQPGRAAGGNAFEPQRHRRARHGPPGGASARSTRCAAAAASVRRTICASTSASAHAVVPIASRSSGRAVPRIPSPASTADQIVVIREGSGVLRRKPLDRRAVAGCGMDP